MRLVRFANSFPTFFDDVFRDFATPTSDGFEHAPPADVRESEKSIELKLDLPGVDPAGIDVKLEGDVLTVSAERKNETTEGDTGWARRERRWGRFSRTFTLPPSVEGTTPEATYKHGVLTLTLPKKAEVLPKTLKVRVEA